MQPAEYNQVNLLKENMEFSKMFIYFTLLRIVFTNFILSSEERRDNDETYKNVKSDEDSDDSDDSDNGSSDRSEEFASSSFNSSSVRVYKIQDSMCDYDSDMDQCQFLSSNESTETDTSSDSSNSDDDDAPLSIDELISETPLFMKLFGIIAPQINLDDYFLHVVVHGIKKKALTYVSVVLNDLLTSHRESSMKLLKNIKATIKNCGYNFKNLCEHAYRPLRQTVQIPTYRDIDKAVKDVANKLKNENITLNEHAKETALQELLRLIKAVPGNFQKIDFISTYLFSVTNQVDSLFLKQLHSPLKLPAFSGLYKICLKLHELLKVMVQRSNEASSRPYYILESNELKKLKFLIEILIKSIEKEIRKDVPGLKNYLNDELKTESVLVFDLMRYFFTRLINDCEYDELQLSSYVPRYNVAPTLAKMQITFQLEGSVLLNACENMLAYYTAQYESDIKKVGTLEGFLSGQLSSVLIYNASKIFQRLFINYKYMEQLQNLKTLLNDCLEISDEEMPRTSTETTPVNKVFIKCAQKKKFETVIKKFEKLIFFVIEDSKVQNRCNFTVAASWVLKNSMNPTVVYAKYALDSIMKLRRELLQEKETERAFKRRKYDDENGNHKESKERGTNIPCGSSDEKKEQTTNTMEKITENEGGEKGGKKKMKRRVEKKKRKEKRRGKKEKKKGKEEEEKKKIWLRGIEQMYPSSSKNKNERMTQIKELTIQSAIALYFLQLSLEKNLAECCKIYEHVNEPA